MKTTLYTSKYFTTRLALYYIQVLYYTVTPQSPYQPVIRPVRNTAYWNSLELTTIEWGCNCLIVLFLLVLLAEGQKPLFIEFFEGSVLATVVAQAHWRSGSARHLVSSAD